MTRRYTPIIDHLTEGLQRVPIQYRGKPLMGAWFACFLRQVELLHDAAEAVCVAFDPDTAVGFRLDWIGKKVGQPRKGSSDEIYRLWIRAKILANRSLGKNSDVRAVAALLLSDLTYRAYGAGIILETSDVLTQEAAHAIVTIVQSAAPCVPVYLYYSALEPLTTAPAGGPFETDGGFDSADGSTDPVPGVVTACVWANDPN